MRFPGFGDGWEHKKLGDIAKFSKGKGISKSDINESGTTECIRYGELYTYYGEVIEEVKSRTNNNPTDLLFSEANDVIIPASGETQIDIATASCVVKSGIALGGDLNIIKTPNNGVFLSYYLNSKKKTEIAKLAQGNSVVHLYSSQLALLKLDFPSFKEQTKIARFLTILDNRINTQSKIIRELELLKISLQKKIFTQELKLSESHKKWHTVKLREVGSFFSGGTPLTTKKQYYDGNIPFIKSGEINSKNTEQFISEEGIKNSSAKLIESGDLIYALYGATSGEVGISKIDGAINQAVLCIRTNMDNIFLFNFLVFNKERILKTYLQGGQGNLSAEIIKSLEVPCPHIQEQQKIASIFSAIDGKIVLETELLGQFMSQKQYFLQNLFI